MTVDFLSRRSFINVSAAALGAAALTRPSIAARCTQTDPGRCAKNVIFMVADGMSLGTLSLADEATLITTGQRCQWMQLMSRAGTRRAMVETSAADSLVTDSAAGGSAWGIGIKTPFRHVNHLSDGTEPTPIGLHIRQHGKKLGLVTTTRITHATPASVFANTPDRERESDIARQLIERGFDVALGGGGRFFPRELLAGATGVGVVRSKDALAAATSAGIAPLLGLFADSHMPMLLDRGADTPSLEDMTRAALALLAPAGNAGDGFFLQIEAGRVDHAAHTNDAGSLLAEQLEFDRTIKLVMDFAQSRDDTLVIITTDHGNANPGLTLYGEPGRAGLQRAMAAKHSFEWVLGKLGTKLAFEDPTDLSRIEDLMPLKTLIAEATGVELSSEAFDVILNAARGKQCHPFIPQAKTITSIIGGVLSDHNAIGFCSPNHTADHVECTAWGPGSERLQPFVPNTALHQLVVEAMALAPAKEL